MYYIYFISENENGLVLGKKNCIKTIQILPDIDYDLKKLWHGKKIGFGRIFIVSEPPSRIAEIGTKTFFNKISGGKDYGKMKIDKEEIIKTWLGISDQYNVLFNYKSLGNFFRNKSLEFIENTQKISTEYSISFVSQFIDLISSKKITKDQHIFRGLTLGKKQIKEFETKKKFIFKAPTSFTKDSKYNAIILIFLKKYSDINGENNIIFDLFVPKGTICFDISNDLIRKKTFGKEKHIYNGIECILAPNTIVKITDIKNFHNKKHHFKFKLVKCKVISQQLIEYNNELEKKLKGKPIKFNTKKIPPPKFDIEKTIEKIFSETKIDEVTSKEFKRLFINDFDVLFPILFRYKFFQNIFEWDKIAKLPQNKIKKIYEKDDLPIGKTLLKLITKRETFKTKYPTICYLEIRPEEKKIRENPYFDTISKNVKAFELPAMSLLSIRNPTSYFTNHYKSKEYVVVDKKSIEINPIMLELHISAKVPMFGIEGDITELLIPLSPLKCINVGNYFKCSRIKKLSEKIMPYRGTFI